MKSKVFISANCSKNAFSAKRLIETFYAQPHLSFYIKESSAYTEGSIIISVSITHIITHVIESSIGLILNFNFNACMNLLHMEYYIKSLVKPEPIEIKKA